MNYFEQVWVLAGVVRLVAADMSLLSPDASSAVVLPAMPKDRQLQVTECS